MDIKAEEISQIIKDQIQDFDKKIELSETGTVLSVGDGIARVYGLEKVQALELVEFPGGILGLALNLEEDNVGVAVMGEDTHIVLFQVQGQPENATGKFDKFHGHDFFKTVDPGNTIPNGQDSTGFTQFDFLVEILDLILDDLTYFFSS